MVLYNKKRGTKLNDLLNNNTKSKNIEELYYKILKIIEKLYDNNIPNNIKNSNNRMFRKNSKCRIFIFESKLPEPYKLCRTF